MKRSYRSERAAAKPDSPEFRLGLEEVCRARISELLQSMLDAEVDEALERLRYKRRAGSKKTGYRDGHDRPRTITSNRGPIDIRRPRVRGTPFSSAVLPKHKRRFRDVDASLTELWLDGLATRDFEGTLRAFLGAEAPLSAATISRVNKQLADELAAWSAHRLDDLDLVFTWADGVYLGAGPDDERRVFLAVLGADREGHKQLVALQEAMSESAAAWEGLFADLKARGLRAPQLIVADGAEGLWNAVTKAWPGAAQQRCWLHYADLRIMPTLPRKRRRAQRIALRRSA